MFTEIDWFILNLKINFYRARKRKFDILLVCTLKKSHSLLWFNSKINWMIYFMGNKDQFLFDII